MAAELEQENMTPVSCRCCDQVVASIAALALELVARHREDNSSEVYDLLLSLLNLKHDVASYLAMPRLFNPQQLTMLSKTSYFQNLGWLCSGFC